MKSKIISKKQLLSLSLVMALGLSVYVNWYYTNNYKDVNEPDTTEQYNLGEAQLVNSGNVESDNADYFTQAKVNRTKAHDEAVKILEDIIADDNYDEEAKTLAKNKLTKISEQIKTEADIENLINANLSNECLVTYNDDSIEIIMPKSTVTDDSVIKIKDIVVSKTNLSAEKIVIIESK